MRRNKAVFLLWTCLVLLLSSCMDFGASAPCKVDSDCLEGHACSNGECIPGQRDSGPQRDGGEGRTDAGGTDSGTPDIGVDAGYDAGHDASHDVGVDAGHDAGEDAGEDGGIDGSVDAGTDAGGFGTAVLDIQKGFAGRSEGGPYKLETVGGFGTGPEMTGGGYKLMLEVFPR